MAEAFFNEMAKGRVKGLSAGTQPAEKVNTVVANAMFEIGLDIRKNKPKILTMDMVSKADKMITMGCGADAKGVCPASYIEMEDWKLEDPEGKTLEEVRRIRDGIKARVTSLVKNYI
jgi:arsenate reductase (thioredoxin)